MIEYGALDPQRQVEIAMMREVYRRRCGRRCIVADGKRVVIRQHVRHANSECARKAAVSVRAVVRQRRADHFQPVEGRDLPVLGVEAVHATVQMMRRFVRFQCDVTTVQRQTPVCNPIRVASDDGADVPCVDQVRVKRVEAKYDIAELTVSIRHAERLHDAAQREKG